MNNGSNSFKIVFLRSSNALCAASHFSISETFSFTVSFSIPNPGSMFDIDILLYPLRACIVRSPDRTRRTLLLRIRRTFLPDTFLERVSLCLHVFFDEGVELLFRHDLFEELDRESLLRSDVCFPWHEYCGDVLIKVSTSGASVFPSVCIGSIEEFIVSV